MADRGDASAQRRALSRAIRALASTSRRAAAWSNREFPLLVVLVLAGSPALYALYRSAKAADGTALQFGGACRDLEASGVTSHLVWDYAFIAVFPLAVVVALAWWWRRDVDAWRRHVVPFFVPLGLWIVADVVENWAIAKGRGECLLIDADDAISPSATLIEGLATAKWALIGIVVIGLLWQIGIRRKPPCKPPIGSPGAALRDRHIGYARAPEEVFDRQLSRWARCTAWEIRRFGQAKYLTAVSGGGYTAAAMSIRALENRSSQAPLWRGVARASAPPLANELPRPERQRWEGLAGASSCGGPFQPARAVSRGVRCGPPAWLDNGNRGLPPGAEVNSTAYLRPASRLGRTTREPRFRPRRSIGRRGAMRCEHSCRRVLGDRPSKKEIFVVDYAERRSVQESGLTHKSDQLQTQRGELSICDGILTVTVQPRFAVSSTSPVQIGEEVAYEVVRPLLVRSTVPSIVDPGPDTLGAVFEVEQQPQVGLTVSARSAQSITIDGWMWARPSCPSLSRWSFWRSTGRRSAEVLAVP